MENLLLSLNVVLPLFIQILCGYVMNRFHWIDDTTNKKLNSLVFKFFLPLLLFKNIYTTNLQEIMNLKLLIFASGSMIIYTIILMLIIPLIEKDNRKRGVLVQGSMRGNIALYGLPLGASILGSEKAGVCSLLIAAIVPTINILSVVVLETYRGGQIKIVPILRGICKNPLVIACAISIVMQVIHLQLPNVVLGTISTMSGVATPLSLIALGAAIRFEDFRSYIKQLTIGICNKLIIGPLVILPITALMGFRGPEFVALMIMCSAPTAVSSYPMADQMGGDGKLASQLVFYSTALSIPSLFVIIFVTKSLGLF